MLGRNILAPGPLLALPVAIAVLLLGCTPRATSKTVTPEAPPAQEEPPPPKRIDRQLEAIADEVDPGEIEPLITAMPEWLSKALRPHTPEGEPAAETLARAREQLDVWDQDQAKGTVGVDSLTKLGAAIYLGEHLLLQDPSSDSESDPDLLVHLTKLYGLIDQPLFTEEQGFFRQSFALIIDEAARQGVLSEQKQVGEFLAFLEAAVTRAGPLKRRSAARLLREHPDHIDVATVIAILADDASRRQDFDRAVELSAIAVDRDRDIDGLGLLKHANHCFVALKIEAGDAAREQAIAKAPAAGESGRERFDKRLARTALLRARAVEANELAADESLEAQFRRGHLLLLLGRYDEGAALYEALKASHPEDARPYAGLTKVALARDFRFMGELPIHAARGLENRDRDFYEVSLGLASGRMMAEVIPAAANNPDKIDAIVGEFLDQVREDAKAWATWEPGRAAVLIALADGIGRTLPFGLKGDLSKLQPAVRRLVSDFDRVRKQHPEVRESWQATYVAALFGKSKTKAWKTVIVPLPESLAGDLELQRQRLETLRNIILLWEEGDPLADLEAALATVPEALAADDVVIETTALLDYLRLRGGDLSAGARAVEAYALLAERRSGAAKAQALANLGVLRSLSGDAAGAIATWEEAISIADERGRDVIFLNAAIQGLSPAILQSLETLSASKHSALIRLQALAWRAELATRTGDNADTAVEEYRAAVSTERSGELRANLPLAGFGILSTGEFNANLGYSIEDALVITLKVNADPWLVPPAPLTLPGALKKLKKPKQPKQPKAAKDKGKPASAAK